VHGNGWSILKEVSLAWCEGKNLVGWRLWRGKGKFYICIESEFEAYVIKKLNKLKGYAKKGQKSSKTAISRRWRENSTINSPFSKTINWNKAES